MSLSDYEDLPSQGNWRRAMADAVICTGFEPQNYLRDRCKKCFRLKSKHDDPPAPPPPINGNYPISVGHFQYAAPVSSPPGSSKGSSTKRRSFRDRRSDNENDVDADDLVSVSSYTSATSKGLSSAKSTESIADTRSMVTAVSGSDADRGVTPTENDPSLVISIADELVYLREENRQLKEDRDRLSLRQQRVNGIGSSNGDPNGNSVDERNLVKMLEDRLNEAESCIQDYRDENTVLKCELRELQENTYSGSETKLADKLKTTETLCEELMEENEALKADVKDLTTEIEEMQDQYREEEIDEFRELQRELEQHAKNSRVLQFKLRKSERSKEQAEAELAISKAKIEELSLYSGSIRHSGGSAIFEENARIRELESELKIAKEVSVRLHGELEQTEEKRYRLEDEVFYLKEKIREMQTQNKWREARNKTEVAVKRLSAELSYAPPPLLPTDDMSKELRDALEREIDMREQLRFAEEDLKRTQLRLQDVESENEVLARKAAKAKGGAKGAGGLSRPPMVRSARHKSASARPAAEQPISESAQICEGNAHLQLELAEHEVEHLSTKVERLEKTNDHLTKKIIELESDSTRRAAAAASGETPALSSGLEKQRFQLTPEMERDMAQLISTIAELEKKNREQAMQLRKGEEIRRREEPDDPVASNTISSDLRSEQERRRGVEAELNEVKSTLLKTDNQKLISLATKVEVLQSQLSLANERCTGLHRKCAKDGDASKYVEELKERVERLEKQLSEQKANTTIAELQGKVPTNDEIESCCEMLASVEAQTSRICKQIERIDLQKDERRRSLSKDSGAAIIVELANVMDELKNVHGLLDNFRQGNGLTANGGGTLTRRSPFRDSSIGGTRSPTHECPRCKEKDEESEKAKHEILFYKKKNKDLTEQVLQTEDRWTIEIEKQRTIFENEIKTLGVKVTDARRQYEEQCSLLNGRTAALAEKTKALDEQWDRNRKLQRDLEERDRRATELEGEKKSAREFEIKYKKLEGIFDQERAKMNTERARNKSELTALKKGVEEADEASNQARDELTKRETLWKSERAAHEREVASLKRQLMRANEEGSMEDNQSRHSSDFAADSAANRSASSEVENALTIELRKQITAAERKNAELGREAEDMRIANVDLKCDLDKVKAQWTKDKEAHQHKTRQTDKIRAVEMDALQQKFSSRMRIMEDTNKSLHSQLVLARRARDALKEEHTGTEATLIEERRRLEGSEKGLAETAARVTMLQKKLVDLEAELERTNTELRLTKEAKKADQILWNMEKGSKGSKNSTPPAAKSDIANAEAVRAQYAEYEKFYAKEVERLNGRVKDMSAEAMARQTETQKIIRELREQIRLLEIDKRNLSDTKESGIVHREMMEAEQSRLQQTVHMSELQKLTRKYRLSSIIDQLQYVSDTRRGQHRVEVDHPDSIRYIICQLTALRDEDANHMGNGGDDRSIATNPPSIMERLDGTDTYDNLSQSSISIRSTASAMPLHTSVRWSNGKSNGGGGSARLNGGGPSSLSSSTSAVPRSTSAGDGWDNGSLSSRRKVSYPDPPPNFLLNGTQPIPPHPPVAPPPATPQEPGRDSIVEYDIDGRRHIHRAGSVGLAVNPLSRSASYDKRNAPLAQPEEPVHFRTNSAGSNILYQVRREELARGGNPSVRLMAKAFESFDAPPNGTAKKGIGLFGVKKSQSVDTQQNDRQSTTGSLSTNRSVITMDEMSTATLPRGGRNPFKNMGTRIVERVRRSLSRSSRRESRERSETAPPSEMSELPRDTLKPTKVDKTSDKGNTSPKKTKKKAAENKARKTTALTGS